MLGSISNYELLVIAIALLILIGPKELPIILYNYGRLLARLRKLSSLIKLNLYDLSLQEDSQQDQQSSLDEDKQEPYQEK